MRQYFQQPDALDLRPSLRRRGGTAVQPKVGTHGRAPQLSPEQQNGGTDGFLRDLPKKLLSFLRGSRKPERGNCGPGSREDEKKPAEAGLPSENRSSLEALDSAMPFSVEQCDRVTLMLLFDQVVSEEQVITAWHHCKDEDVTPAHTLWRVLAQFPEVNRTAVYSRAARVYGFSSVDFNMYSARALVRKVRRHFERKDWVRMAELNVIPVQSEFRSGGRSKRHWTFASSDPSHPAVRRLLSRLGVASFVLCYAPARTIEAVISDALPALAKEEKDQRAFTLEIPSTSPSAERVLRRARRRLQELEDRSQEEEETPRCQPHTGTGAGRDSASPTDPSEVLDLAINGLLRRGARIAYLLPEQESPGGLVAHYVRDNRSDSEQLSAHLPAGTMCDYATGQLQWLPPDEDLYNGIIEHWVGSGRIRLRLAVEPLGALPRVLADAASTCEHEQAVVIERISGQ